MELSWLMKIRIAAAAAVGVILIGILAWPLAKPPELSGIVSLASISLGRAMTLVALAILAGFLAYFFSWPYGLQIAILAVPAGLAIWAVRTGDIAGLIQLNPNSLQYRQEIFDSLKWEPLFWLLIVAAGFIGVLLAHMVFYQKAKQARPAPYVEKLKSKPELWFLFELAPVIAFLFSLGLVADKISKKTGTGKAEQKSNPKLYMYLNRVLAVVVSALIAQVCMIVFAQDIKLFDSKLVTVIAQPAVGQIVLAVLLAFAIAAFVVKKFLDAGYIWPIIASAFITAVTANIYGKQEILHHLVQNQPANFFSTPIMAILPIQMVAFGTIGSIAGYWLAVRFNYWRQHESG
jgi:hypothetical protein